MSNNPSVAILTLYYENFNYGALLQAYALQKVLTDLGYDTKQISYKLQTGYKQAWYHSLLQMVKRPIKKIYRWFFEAEQIQFENNLREFANAIPHTRVITAENINELTNEFDVFICGSDQIWNPIGWQPTLFLDFLPKDKCRIAYAASMAREELTDNELDFAWNYIKDFTAVSVRETKTKLILNKYCNEKKIELMPDPTMLICRLDWINIANQVKGNINEPYILAYFLGSELKYRESAIQMANKLGIKIIFIPYVCREVQLWEKNHVDLMANAVGIPKFLSLILGAKAVVTDSYHGAVFSIIFKKSFYVLQRFAEGDKNSMNSRYETLLDYFGLNDCIGKDLPKDGIRELSDEQKNNIDSILCMLQDRGIQFLKKSLDKSFRN